MKQPRLMLGLVALSLCGSLLTTQELQAHAMRVRPPRNSVRWSVHRRTAHHPTYHRHTRKTSHARR